MRLSLKRLKKRLELKFGIYIEESKQPLEQ